MPRRALEHSALETTMCSSAYGTVIRVRIPSVALAVAAVWAAGGLVRAAGQPAAAPAILTGAYTEEQALLGRELYYQHCLQCHGETMAGADKAPPLVGPQFASTWTGAPLAALVARIATMPPEQPASLLQEQRVAILAYVLWYNGLPLGNERLPVEQDGLTKITFQVPPSQ
jgi:mono/diheme cytochrome c family protein